jgi:hypothetical protein
MQIGIDSFVAAVPDTLTGENLGSADRLSHLLDEIECADRVGLDVFGIGEHHRAEFLDSAPETILAANVRPLVRRQVRLRPWPLQSGVWTPACGACRSWTYP